MGSRSTVLFVLLLFLLGFAGYYYREEVVSYARKKKLLEKYPTVRKTLNRGLKMAGYPPLKKPVDPSKLRENAVRTYRRALVNSLPVESLRWRKLFESKGVESTVSVRLNTGRSAQNPSGPFRGTLDLRTFKNGQGSAELTVNQSTTHQFKNASITVRKQTVYATLPGLGLRLSLPSFLSSRSAPIDWGLTAFRRARPARTAEARFQGQPVHRLNLETRDQGVLRMFVPREKPRRLIGVRAVKGTRTYERRFRYRGGEPSSLSDVRTFRNETLISRLSIDRSGNNTVLTLKNPQSQYLRQVVARFTSSGDNPSAGVSFRPATVDEPISLGTLNLTMNRGIPRNFSFRFDYGGSSHFPVQLSGQLQSESLQWLDDVRRVSVERTNRTTTTPMGLLEKVFRSNTRRLAKKRRAAAKQESREESAEPDEETEPPAGSGQDDAEEQESDEDASGPAGDGGEEGTESKTESEPGRKRTLPRRSPETVPYPELTKAPRESGETVYRSPGYNFPYTEPPRSYQSAQRDYYAGKFEDARQKLKKLLTRYPKSVNVNYLLGVMNYELAETVKARKFFERVFSLRHDPQLRAWSKHYLNQLGDTTAVSKQ